ncbi:calcium/proton exchanger [Dichomitus squalens]|uniref:Calcium/proton exchanger n=1 Tax=Dichomitus squalens TaxID=114155 RepID=A0A4Q9NS48_9APHY|nr:calcium/proton exchanger [Dichomitus squalens]TBU43607.1 calcium/proton exchanger [Dichomitus squalens]TBU65477.1 calcium/proton exchanger [Dichomitus squalens]
MSAVTDRTPLLENGNGAHHPKPFFARVADSLSVEGQPSWLHSYKFFVFGSYFNILLLFVPLSVVAHQLNWDAALRFSFSFIAIMPLAALLGTATEQLSLKLGQTLSGLLNATFGNAVEIIVGIAALLQGELRIVQTSLLGSILSNLLLVLGCSFFAGGLKFHESNFQVTAAQASSSLMTLTCITLVIPAAYHSAKSHGGVDTNVTDIAVPGIDAFNKAQMELGLGSLDSDAYYGLKIISRGTAILLLFVYIAYLIFQLRTHSDLYVADAIAEEEEEEPQMNTLAAGSALLLVTLITSFCADYLVASIEETAERYHIPKPFIGLILLPIVANAAEHVTSVWMALKNKMELTIGICVGSSIQIAAFVVPLLVIVGWITHHDLTLFFADFETIVLFVSVLLVNFLIQDGKSNYMEGLMLITLYLVIALAFWVS